MKNLGATLAFAASLACAPALAQRTPYASPWYVGVGMGQGSVNFTHVPSFLSDDEKDTVYQVRVGYRFHPNLGVELGYYHLGEYSISGGSGDGRITAGADARSAGISLVGTLPLDRFDLYGRLGYARSEVSAIAGFAFRDAFGFGGFNQRAREDEVFGGVGARWNINRELGVFAEYQRHDKLEVQSYFIGVDMRF